MVLGRMGACAAMPCAKGEAQYGRRFDNGFVRKRRSRQAACDPLSSMRFMAQSSLAPNSWPCSTACPAMRRSGTPTCNPAKSSAQSNCRPAASGASQRLQAAGSDVLRLALVFDAAGLEMEGERISRRGSHLAALRTTTGVTRNMLVVAGPQNSAFGLRFSDPPPSACIPNGYAVPP